MGSPEVTRDKAAAFEKLFGKRIAEIVDRIDTLGNLSNPYNYTFTEERIDGGFADLEKAFQACKERFAKGLREQPLVGTGRRNKATAPAQAEEQRGSGTGTAPSAEGSPELAETTSQLVDEASESAKKAEMERIEREDVPAFLKKKA